MTTTAASSATSTYTPFTITSFPGNPLTTTFTPTNSDCSGVYLPTSLNIFLIHDQLTCLPSGFSTAEKSFFSPGIACPSGYWSACHDNTGVASITTVTCCPTHGSDVSLSCLDPATLAGRWRSLFCTWTAGAQTKVIKVTESGSGRTSTVAQTMSGGQGLNAYGVRMVHQSTDLVVDSSSTQTRTGRSSPASSATSSEAPSPTSDVNSGSGLPTGAAIGIGVAIPVVVLALLAAFLVLWRRRRRERADISPTTAAASLDPQRKPETYFYGGPPVYQGRPPSELPTRQHTAEMATSQLAIELPADERPGSQQRPRGQLY